MYIDIFLIMLLFMKRSGPGCTARGLGRLKWSQRTASVSSLRNGRPTPISPEKKPERTQHFFNEMGPQFTTRYQKLRERTEHNRMVPNNTEQTQTKYQQLLHDIENE